MDADQRRWRDRGSIPPREITNKILGAFYDVRNELGHGFLESVYREAMLIALAEHPVTIVETKVPVDVWFRGHRIKKFEADLVVDRLVLVELKAKRDLDPSDEAQILNYLRATPFEVGLLLNVGVTAKFKRFAFSNARKASMTGPIFPPASTDAAAPPHA